MKRTYVLAPDATETQSKLIRKRKSFVLTVVCVLAGHMERLRRNPHLDRGSTDGRWSIGANWEGNNPPAANESPLHLVFRQTLHAPGHEQHCRHQDQFDQLRGSGLHHRGFRLRHQRNHRQFGGQFPGGMSAPSAHRSHFSLLSKARSGRRFRIHNIATNASVTVRSTLDNVTANSGLSKDGPGTLVLDP
jgi:hypothetical protein